jgi:hypothetical protein
MELFKKGTDILAMGYCYKSGFETVCVFVCLSECGGCCTGAACGSESTASKVSAEVCYSSISFISEHFGGNIVMLNNFNFPLFIVIVLFLSK